jgi:hypothetical protein
LHIISKNNKFMLIFCLLFTLINVILARLLYLSWSCFCFLERNVLLCRKFFFVVLSPSHVFLLRSKYINILNQLAHRRCLLYDDGLLLVASHALGHTPIPFPAPANANWAPQKHDYQHYTQTIIITICIFFSS